MSISIRLSEPADHTAILDLMQRSRGDDLSAAERAKRGFVQGTMNAETLRRFEAGTGIFLAVDGDRLAGFAMTSEPGATSSGPPKSTLDVATAAYPDATLLLYGPAAVDVEFQGRGVLSSLLVTLSAHLVDRFDRAAAFVERANEKSLAVHRHFGMDETGVFEFQARQYVVFTFDLAAMASRQ